MSKRILVTGGTGTIGAPLVKKLIEQGAEVVVLTRSSEKARKLPKGATALIGAFEDISILKRGLQGCDEHYQSQGLHSSEDDLSQMHRLLGRHPRKFSEFAMECANSWEKLPPMVKVKAGLTALKMTVGKNFQKVSG